jgi:hypothetical protein
VNPGRYPELPRAARPRPQVWTPALTGRWQLEGGRPAVGVWTAAQTSPTVPATSEMRPGGAVGARQRYRRPVRHDVLAESGVRHELPSRFVMPAGGAPAGAQGRAA